MANPKKPSGEKGSGKGTTGDTQATRAVNTATERAGGTDGGGQDPNAVEQQPQRVIPEGPSPQELERAQEALKPGPDATDVLGDTDPPSAPAPDFAAPELAAGAKEPTEQIGGTGLRGAEPLNGWLWEEYLPRLRGTTGAQKFREMADNDPTCGAVLYALEMLMRNVQWRVDPANETPEAIVAAERVEGALFRDMAHPWGDLIDEATSMLTYGYSPHEIIFKRCRGETDDPMTTSQYDDGLLMPADIPVRAQETIWRWVFDDKGKGHVIGFQQYLLGEGMVTIPMVKALIFRTISRRNNPEGFSILRRAFVGYERKKVIEQAEGRLALRSAGIVDVRIPGKFLLAGATGDERAVAIKFQQMADLLAQDRSGSVVLPSDRDDKGNPLYDLKYTVADSRQVKDFTPIIDRIDLRAAMSVLADFLLLGSKNVGSWALGSEKTSLFELAVQGYNGVIGDQVNRSLIPKLWKLNALDPKTMPKAVPGNVRKIDLDALGNFLSKLQSAGAQFFPSMDGKLEQWLLAAAELPTTELDNG